MNEETPLDGDLTPGSHFWKYVIRLQKGSRSGRVQGPTGSSCYIRLRPEPIFLNAKAPCCHPPDLPPQRLRATGQARRPGRRCPPTPSCRATRQRVLIGRGRERHGELGTGAERG